MNHLPGEILGWSETISSLTQGLRTSIHPFALLDILIVAVLFYWIYLFLRETRAMQILWGIAILGFLLLLGRLLNLTLLNFVMRYLVTSIFIAIPVVFQPELRAALERLGRTRFVPSDFGRLRRIDVDVTTDTIVQAVQALAKRKIGALIVIAGRTGLREFVETGINLNADLTKEMLWNIFTPKTPLHDGAVIMAGDKILSASSRLPLSDENFAANFGTRHRAGLGLSSQTDAFVIVVSEERGKISVALAGRLIQDISADELADRLKSFYRSLNRKLPKE